MAVDGEPILTREELVGVLVAEIKRYSGFTVEVARLGEYESIKISRGQCSYDLLVHPMIGLNFIELVRLILDCIAMYASKMEVTRDAV